MTTRSAEPPSHPPSAGLAKVQSPRPTLFAKSPTLDGEDGHYPCHQYSHQTHGHSVHKHGIQVVMNHPVDSTFTLRTCVSLTIGLVPDMLVTYAGHEYDTPRNQSKCREQLRGWARRQDRPWRADVHDNVGEASGK